MTPKRRRDLVLTSLWRYYCVVSPLDWHAVRYMGRITDIYLTHRGHNEIAAISKTIFLVILHCEKYFVLWFQFHLNVFQRIPLIINRHWFTQWLGAELVTGHHLNQWRPSFYDAIDCHKAIVTFNCDGLFKYETIVKIPDVLHIFDDIRHYSDIIMSAMVSQITGVSIVCSALCSGADQRKHQSSASLASVRGIHRWPVNSPHKGS